MNTYFETSAIIKLVVQEDGSDAAGAVWDASDLAFTSRLSYVEARAALAAAHRARRLSAPELRKAKQGLDRRFAQLDVVEVTDRLVRTAGELSERFGLRGYDAVHLASSLALGPRDVVVATWDRALARASRESGFAIAGTKLRTTGSSR